LSPFIEGVPKNELKETLRLFIYNLNQSLLKNGSPVEASLGLEFSIPDFLEEKEAIGPKGKTMGIYSDFIEESRLIASLLLEVISKESERKPIFNPSLIIKIRPEVLKNKDCESLLLQSHKLASENGTPYFANLNLKTQKGVSYTATGCRFAPDWKEDWELDTLRTGEIGNVILNLARVSYDSGKKQTKFFEILDERLEMAIRALEIKYKTIKLRAREGVLPFLSQKVDGNQYFRLENASRLVSFVGLNETIKSITDQYIYENDKALNLAEEIIRHLYRSVKRYSKKPETRVSLSMLPNANASKRLAELDVEKYGWSEVHAQRTREQPFYTDMVVLPLESNVSWKERLSVEEKFHELTPGSHMAIIQLNDSESDPNDLLLATRHILKTKIGIYAYNRNLAYCNSCQKTFHGILSKCPLCGSVNTLVGFSRMSAKYLPLSHWIPAKRLVLNKRTTLT
jgi:ribonucleoside-triphosphate reductase